jgi:glutamyl-tRNA synthetase
MQKNPGYRGRLAPSPTGLLHVGHARTFWTAYQRARDAHGTLVLRMEDLDPQRSHTEFAQAALEDLRWLGIRWQEGPDLPPNASAGDRGPYYQSKRRSFYLAAWRRLYNRGAIYACRCSRKELALATTAPHEDNESIYPGTCRNNRSGPMQLGGHAVQMRELVEPNPMGINWRFRVPDGEVITFYDERLGQQRFVAGADFGDFLVWRRDDVPAYQLACVVDDAEMGITEVVRGADLLKSTARQILLNRALGYSDPKWYHCELITDHNGERLAKRHDSLSLRALRQRGVTPLKIFSADLPVSE